MFLPGPLATGEDMIESVHPLTDQLKDRVRVVQGKWAMLKEEAAIQEKSHSYDACPFFSNCNETDSLIMESITLAKNISILSRPVP
jgi:hypothetical protein